VTDVARILPCPRCGHVLREDKPCPVCRGEERLDFGVRIRVHITVEPIDPVQE